MALFKKKAARDVDGARAQMSVVADELAQNAIAFGVTWRAIASRNVSESDAIKAARAGGATHLIRSVTQFGFGRLPADAPRDATLYAAAKVAARLHGGDAIYALKLFEGEYWLAVIRGGQPSNIDRIITATNDVELIEAVQSELHTGIEDGTTYTVYTNLEDPGFDEARGLDAADLLMALGSQDDVLQPIPTKRRQIPVPVIVAIVGAALAACANKGWEIYQAKERQRLLLLNRVVDEPPEQAWARATKAWADQHRSADPQGLAAVRVSLGKVPLVWGGWNLQSGVCSAQDPAASTGVAGQAGATAKTGTPDRRWSCVATYTRGQAGRLNREMQSDIPAGWTIQYRGLDTIIGSWTVAQSSQAFNFEGIRSIEHHLVETVSRLQRLQPAFSQVADLNFAPVEITPPRKADGTAVPPLASTPVLRMATFSLKAPLRSVDALIDAGIDADWQQISVAVVSDQNTKAGLKSSALTADVKGQIYAKP